VSATADASFLIGISVVELVGVAEQVIGACYVPPAVWTEVVVQGDGRPRAARAPWSPWLQLRPVHNQHAVEALTAFLGRGESEAVVLAQELGCTMVLTDDLRARHVVRQAGLTPMGVIGFLLAAKAIGRVDEVRPLISRLQAAGFRLGSALVAEALRSAGEDLVE